MNRARIIFALLVALAVAIGSAVVLGRHLDAKRHRRLPLSAADQAEIEALVKKETDEPIWLIRVNEADRRLISVLTGAPRAFTSDGNVFVVKWTRRGWVVVYRSVWHS